MRERKEKAERCYNTFPLNSTPIKASCLIKKNKKNQFKNMTKNNLIQTNHSFYDLFKVKSPNLGWGKILLFTLLISIFCQQANAGNLTVYRSEQTLTIRVSGQTVARVLELIEKESGFRFYYNNRLIDVNRLVSINAVQKDIFSILDEVFKNNAVHYKVVDKDIILTRANETDQQQKDRKTVSGLVTDEQNSPIIGANIKLKGSDNGTVSDIDGNFSLPLAKGDVLLVTYIGYLAQEVTVGSKTPLSIILKEDSKQLEEVVVVGYGTQKKVNLTGAIEQVTDEVFENRSVSNITQALQGAIPNLNITLSDGKPTRTASFNVRGTTSIGQGGEALVLIDGAEGDPSMLNPNDIASVSVLKDASSAAVYGARGSFGVVLITTKTPDKDRFTITYSGDFAVKRPVTTPDFVTDGYTYSNMFYTAYNAWNNYSATPKNINKSQAFSSSWLDTFKSRKEQGITDEVETAADGTYTYFGNTDYYKELYKKNVFAQDHNMSVAGNSGKVNYYISGRYYDYDGLFRYNSDTYNTLNLRAKGSIQVFDWLRIDNNTDFSHLDYHNPMNVGEGGSIWRNISDEGHPSAPIYNPDGSLTMSAAYTIGDFIYGKNGIDTNNKVLKNTTSFSATFFNKALRVNGDFTFSATDKNSTQIRVPVPYSKVQGTTIWLGTSYNDLKKGIQKTDYLATNLYAEYEKTFGKDHYFKGMMGYNYEQSKYEGLNVQRNGLLTEDSENINLALGESITTSSGYEKWRIAGGFFRLNYAYKNRYLFEVNGRYDGSSKFPTDEQWAFFPSASVGWRVSAEPFWKVNPDIISDFKIRGSYGALGNGNVSSYSYMELFSIGTSGRVLNGLKNKYTSSPAVKPDGLTWETATTTNVGIDLSMLQGKLHLTGDAYIRKTTDMYTAGVTLPDVFGANSPKGNYADMTTKGWELSLGYKDRFMLGNSPFVYEVRATLSDYTSKIDRYNNSTKSLNDYYEGQTVGEIWGYVTEGLFQSQADIDNHATQTFVKSSTKGIWYPGDVKLKDLDGSKTIDYGTNTVDNHGDLKVIGNKLPRYIYSFTLGGEWKNVFFSAFFQGVGRQHWYPGNESIFWGQYNRPYNNLPTWHLNNYWTEENPNAYLPRYAGYNSSIKTTVQTRYLQNVAYIRLKNLQIGYNLPQQLISKVRMQKARIYLSGENLWNWSPLYKHTRDMDVSSIYGSDIDLTDGTSGDGNNYPTMSSISLGLSITF